MKSTILFLAGLSAMVLAAADLPEPVLPQGVGVNIHFTRGHERDLDLMAASASNIAWRWAPRVISSCS